MLCNRHYNFIYLRIFKFVQLSRPSVPAKERPLLMQQTVPLQIISNFWVCTHWAKYQECLCHTIPVERSKNTMLFKQELTESSKQRWLRRSSRASLGRQNEPWRSYRRRACAITGPHSHICTHAHAQLSIRSLRGSVTTPKAEFIYKQKHAIIRSL